MSQGFVLALQTSSSHSLHCPGTHPLLLWLIVSFPTVQLHWLKNNLHETDLLHKHVLYMYRLCKGWNYVGPLPEREQNVILKHSNIVHFIPVFDKKTEIIFMMCKCDCTFSLPHVLRQNFCSWSLVLGKAVCFLLKEKPSTVQFKDLIVGQHHDHGLKIVQGVLFTQTALNCYIAHGISSAIFWVVVNMPQSNYDTQLSSYNYNRSYEFSTKRLRNACVKPRVSGGKWSTGSTGQNVKQF